MEIKIHSALEGERLEKLEKILADQAITDDLLEQITDQDLQDLGIAKLGERRRLLRAFQAEAGNLTMLSQTTGGRLPDDSELAGTEVASFKIGRHSVRQNEWDMVRIWSLPVGYEIHSQNKRSAGNPVVCMSWYDALKWCNAMSERQGFSPAYFLHGRVYRTGDFGPDGAAAIAWDKNANGFRLPIEAEWECAAREGTMEPIVDLTDTNRTRSKADAIGLSNMSGDFFDWCWDFDASVSQLRIRGGTWKHHIGQFIFGYRSSSLPNECSGVIGLRLAQNIPGFPCVKKGASASG